MAAASSVDEFLGQHRPIPHLCGTSLGARAHICAFFRDSSGEDQALLPFIKEGLAADEKVIYTVDPKKRADHINRLAAAGVDFLAAHQQGRFDLRLWTETHLNGGGFDAARTFAFFNQIGVNASRQGFPLTRFVTHMEWALESGVILTDLLEYEAKANEIWLGRTGPINPVICAYDLKKFSGEVIVDVMRTHPMTVIDGILYENPFYVPPEDFIRDLRSRATSRVAGS